MRWFGGRKEKEKCNYIVITKTKNKFKHFFLKNPEKNKVLGNRVIENFKF